MSQSTNPVPDAVDPPARGAGKRWIIPAFILLAIVLFLGTEAVLYYRWATMTEPTCVLVVDGGTAIRGAAITVNGPRLPHPYVSVMGKGEQYSLPFYLEPDRYTLTVTMDGKDLFQGSIALSAPGSRIDLTHLILPPTTQSATATAGGGGSRG